ncbi:MAG: hypothetical protein QOH93_3360 [Chloroflexia bacterium]|jgi:hypothetical protein|nr:hypothetical protein [Chloroflexia bacterium]
MALPSYFDTAVIQFSAQQYRIGLYQVSIVLPIYLNIALDLSLAQVGLVVRALNATCLDIALPMQ